MNPYSMPGCKITPEHVIAIVEEEYNLKTGEIYKKSNSPVYSFPRYVAMYIFRFKFGWTLYRIAQKFRKDHATVIYATKSVRNAIAFDPRFREKYNHICKMIDYK